MMIYVGNYRIWVWLCSANRVGRVQRPLIHFSDSVSKILRLDTSWVRGEASGGTVLSVDPLHPLPDTTLSFNATLRGIIMVLTKTGCEPSKFHFPHPHIPKIFPDLSSTALMIVYFSGRSMRSVQ
jgi:hypothetical protein